MRPSHQRSGLAGALVLTLAALTAPLAAQDAPTFVDLGTCPTVSGEVVLDCRIAYRTAGRLNAARDNAVLIPTWYGGSSKSLARLVGPDAMVDTTRFFVVLVDGLGFGVATSPSNSRPQPGAQFPRINVADMVDAQHRLVREHLGLPRLHAVVGFSLGAMQALEWAVRHPADVGAVVSLLGSPRPAAHDLFTMRALRWMAQLGASGIMPEDSTRVPLLDLWHVIADTPAKQNRLDVAAIDSLVLREAVGWKNFDLDDNQLQLDAIIAHDVAASFGGDLEQAAARVRARMLVVVSPDDRIVGSEPAVAFARMANAELLSVPSPCGHFALYCEPVVAERVRAFLIDP